MVDDQKEGKKHFTVVIERAGLTGAKVLIWALIAAVALWYFWFKYTERLGIASPEAFEYGQIARNNLRGKWFETDVIRPVGLWLDHRLHNRPDLCHPPAYSVVLTGLMTVGGAQDRTLLWGSGLLVVLLHARRLQK